MAARPSAASAPERGAPEPGRRPRARRRPRGTASPSRPPGRRSRLTAISDDRVEHDLARRLGLATHDRQHRHAGGRVVAAVAEGQRPEVRRRPVEDDREQHERRQSDLAGHRGPGHEDRHAAGRTADDDVLRRRALQPHRVHEDVEGRRARRPGRALSRLTVTVSKTKDSDAQRDAERERARGRDRVARQWADAGCAASGRRCRGRRTC